MVWSTPAAAALPVPVPEGATLVQDRDLVHRCLNGDGPAWDELLRLHARRVYTLCLRFTGRPQDAEDLSQEAFLRIYRNLSAWRAEAGSFTTWITVLTRNLLIDHYRKSRADRQTDSLDADPDAPPRPEPIAAGIRADDRVWQRELHEQVQAALCELSPELREAVILRDLQDFDYKEIAQMLRIPEGTVKSRINRGRIELARRLHAGGNRP